MTLKDSELAQELEHYVQQDTALSILGPDATNDLLDSFAAHHGFDLQKLWLWTQASDGATTLSYSLSEDALAMLEEVVPDTKNDFILVATDDELPPWIAISSATLQPLLALVGEHRFFEFFLTSSDASWYVFDTHHKTIVHSAVMK